jgi:hypothetical protein
MGKENSSHQHCFFDPKKKKISKKIKKFLGNYVFLVEISLIWLMFWKNFATF